MSNEFSKSTSWTEEGLMKMVVVGPTGQPMFDVLDVVAEECHKRNVDFGFSLALQGDGNQVIITLKGLDDDVTRVYAVLVGEYGARKIEQEGKMTFARFLETVIFLVATGVVMMNALGHLGRGNENAALALAAWWIAIVTVYIVFRYMRGGK